MSPPFPLVTKSAQITNANIYYIEKVPQLASTKTPLL